MKIRKKIFIDIFVIFISILVAIILIKSGIILKLINSIKNFEIIGSFISGLFFTTIFTTAPAIASLKEIATASNYFQTALLGSIGAVCGDFIIFKFIKNKFGKHIIEIMKYNSYSKRVVAFIKTKSFRWLSIFIGSIIIASPLPDEIGISIMGISKIKTGKFILLSFIFNFIGILLITNLI